MRIKDSRVVPILLLVAVLHTVGTSSLLAFQKDAKSCLNGVYRGPDSRLSSRVLGKVSPGPIVGLEILDGRPIVAQPHMLLTVEKKATLELPLSFTARGISIGGDHDLRIQTDSAIERIEDKTFVSDDPLSHVVRGRLYGSGSRVFLEVRVRGNLVQFVARRRNGESFVISTIKGLFRTASWNEYGLAAVVGNGLFVWPAGTRKLLLLMRDEGLNHARDIALAGPTRAIVALENVVILVTSETVTVVGTAAQAHCRFAAGVLYLLDGRTRLIWAIEGLDRLGTKAGDEAYARTLIHTSNQIREAARILGCAAVLKKSR